MKKKIEIPKQPPGLGAGIIWMATYFTGRFIACLLTIVFSIIALSVGYSGKYLTKEPIKVMEKIHERKNR